MRYQFDVLNPFPMDKYHYLPLRTSETGNRRSKLPVNGGRAVSYRFLLISLATVCLLAASFIAGRHSIADTSLLTVSCEWCPQFSTKDNYYRVDKMC